MSIRSNVIISTVTALCVSNAIVLILCAWLQCSTCGSRPSSFVHNAPSFEPAALPEAAGSGPLSSSPQQRTLFPVDASMFTSVGLNLVNPIFQFDPPKPSYQYDRVGLHPGTGPPVKENTYLYIYRYPGSFEFTQKNTLSATAFKAGAFGFVGSFCLSAIHAVMPSFGYEPDYSFQFDIA